MLGDTDAHVATTDLESDYEILGELGRGATAVVYRARDRELGREVAIKVIRPKYADDDETVARLAREARTVAQLQHPNIVTLYAVRRVRDGSLALVMQLVPGRTLREILNSRGACTFGWVDRVLRDVGAALAHAHQRGIVHRDVKPENIFIDETTGQALLSDFGVARSLEPDSQLTATGTAIGTPAYMSPEQIDGTTLDGRSDLYSLGLVGWEMLTGRRPWEGESLYSVIYKQ
jgi:serine/threonine protein kinase